MDEKIKCPKCNHEFQIHDLLLKDEIMSMKKEMEKEIKSQFEKDYERKKQEENALLKEELVKSQKALEDEKKDKQKLKDDIKENFQKEMKKKEEESRKKEEQNQSFYESKINSLMHELEKNNENELEIKKKYDLKIKEIEEENKIELEKRNKQIMALKEDAEGSQQRKGEIQELILEDYLKEIFSIDRIEEVKKGKKGADVIHHIKHKNQEVGIILYESKNTKEFQPGWIQKLKEDQELEKADICILVTKAMPNNVKENYFIKDGVYVIKMDFDNIKIFASLLREGIIQAYDIKSSFENSSDKASQLFRYINSNDFKNRFDMIKSKYNRLRESVQKQKTYYDKEYAKQIQLIDDILSGLNYTSGEIESITDSSDTYISSKPQNEELF